MTSEVIAREIGILRAADFREVEPGVREVRAIVVGAAGPPFVGSVRLGEKVAGPARHRAVMCNACHRPVLMLVLHAGALACRGCARRRTRRQAERSCRSWANGGAVEDAVLRALAKGTAGDVVPPRVLALVDELVAGDAARWAALQADVSGVRAVAAAGHRLGVLDLDDGEDEEDETC